MFDKRDLEGSSVGSSNKPSPARVLRNRQAAQKQPRGSVIPNITKSSNNDASSIGQLKNKTKQQLQPVEIRKTIRNEAPAAWPSESDNESDSSYIPSLQSASDSSDSEDCDSISDDGEYPDIEEGSNIRFVPGISDRQPFQYKEMFERKGAGKKSYRSYADKTKKDIYLEYMGKTLDRTLHCTNINLLQNRHNEIGMNQLLRFIAIEKLMTLVKMPDIRLYWIKETSVNLSGLETFKLPNFSTIMSRGQYTLIKNHLRFENYNDIRIDKEDPIWKMRKLLEEFRMNLRTVLPCPGKKLAMDESMVKLNSRRCPIYRHLREKPIKNGMRVFAIFDKETQTLFDFIVDDGILNSKNCNHLPYKFSGKIVLELCKHLPGTGYECFADNMYISPALCVAGMKDEHKIGFIGPLRRDRGVPAAIKFIEGKKPKPTAEFPRGFIRHSYNVKNDDIEEGQICIYAYMDTTVVYLCDSIYGPNMQKEMIRKTKVNGVYTVFTNEVPEAFPEYCSNMNSVDVGNQERTGWYGTEMDHKCSKWTSRLFQYCDNISTCNTYRIWNLNHSPSQQKNKLKRFHRFNFTLELCSELIQCYDMDSREVQIEGYRGLARGGADNAQNGHSIVCLPIGSDRGRCQRRVCKHCSDIGAHKGSRSNRKKRETAFMCNICVVPLHRDCLNAYHRVNNIPLFPTNHQTPLPPSTTSAKKRNRSS